MKVVLPRVRLVYPHLFTPQESMEEGKDPRYGANFIIDPASPAVTEIKQAMLTVANELWKGNGLAVLNALEGRQKCLRNGNSNIDSDGAIRNGFKDMMYVVASNLARPTVIDRNRAPLAEADNKIYGGCWVNAIVDVYALDNPGKRIKGVFAELRGVQFVADDEPLGRGASVASADEFDVLQDEPPVPGAANGMDGLGF